MNILKDARQKSGLSQREVANKLGYSTPQFVSNWERGISTPPLKIIGFLESLYGVKLKEAMIKNLTDDFERKIRKEINGKTLLNTKKG